MFENGFLGSVSSLRVYAIQEFPRISWIRNTFLHRISHYLKRQTRETLK